jgi:hypothetical protein
LGGCAPPGTGPSRGWHAACADHWRGTRQIRLCVAKAGGTLRYSTGDSTPIALSPKTRRPA